MTDHAIVPRDDRSANQRLFGLPVRALPARPVIDWLIRSARRGGNTCVMAAYLNAHVSNLAARDRALNRVLASADLLYADGMSIVWALKAARGGGGHRASAAHFLPQFCWAAAAHGLPIALVGGATGLAESASRVLSARIPGLRIVYTHHGYLDRRGIPQIIESIRKSGAAIVLIGMGSPHQEHFAASLRAARACRVAWCVGALFEYFGSGRRRAPTWVRNAGFEWLYRFAQEPGRLAGRYTIGNALFTVRALGEVLGGRT